MVGNFYKGDFIRWVAGHDTYESDGDTLYGTDPIYYHGIVLEVSDLDSSCIIVHTRDAEFAPRLVVLNSKIDQIEILSSTEIKND